VAEQIGNLNVRITADNTGLISAVRSSAEEIKKFATSSKESADQVRSLFADQKSTFASKLDSWFKPDSAKASLAQLGGEVKTSLGDIACEVVVNCAGQWAYEIGQLAGVNVPVQSVEHPSPATEAPRATAPPSSPPRRVSAAGSG